jgi:hypothetical protein
MWSLPAAWGPDAVLHVNSLRSGGEKLDKKARQEERGRLFLLYRSQPAARLGEPVTRLAVGTKLQASPYSSAFDPVAFLYDYTSR